VLPHHRHLKSSPHGWWCKIMRPYIQLFGIFEKFRLWQASAPRGALSLDSGRAACYVTTYPKKHPYLSLPISSTMTAKSLFAGHGSYFTHFLFARCQYNCHWFVFLVYLSLATPDSIHSSGLSQRKRRSYNNTSWPFTEYSRLNLSFRCAGLRFRHSAPTVLSIFFSSISVNAIDAISCYRPHNARHQGLPRLRGNILHAIVLRFYSSTGPRSPIGVRRTSMIFLSNSAIRCPN